MDLVKSDPTPTPQELPHDMTFCEPKVEELEIDDRTGIPCAERLDLGMIINDQDHSWRVPLCHDYAYYQSQSLGIPLWKSNRLVLDSMRYFEKRYAQSQSR